MESTTTKKEKKYPKKIIFSKNSNKIHNIFNYWVLLILEDINFHGFKEYVNSLRLFLNNSIFINFHTSVTIELHGSTQHQNLVFDEY